MDGLTVIGADANLRYYRGRWRSLKPDDSGLFVGRRPQAYGSDLWCLVLVHDGAPQRLIDFPVENADAPAHDEAWRIQAALDACAGTPQTFRVEGAPGNSRSNTAHFFTPLPRWAERYLELVGMPVPRSTGALFSYRVPEDALPELTTFLTQMLWMRRETLEERRGH